jgi:hypothetical protein
MNTRLQTSVLAPWAGLFLGAFGWFLHHQTASDANYFDCRQADGVFAVWTGILCAVIVAGGGLISWLAGRGQGDGRGQNHRFGRLVGMAASAIFLLAVGFQTLAGVLVPACHR